MRDKEDDIKILKSRIAGLQEGMSDEKKREMKVEGIKRTAKLLDRYSGSIRQFVTKCKQYKNSYSLVLTLIELNPALADFFAREGMPMEVLKEDLAKDKTAK